MLCTFAACLIVLRPTEVPPLWFDEGWNLSVARNLAERQLYAQLSLGQPTPATFLSTGLPVIAPLALSFKMFGVGVWQSRLPGQLFTALALLLFYMLTRKLYNARVATASLFVALLMIGVHIHLHPILLGRQALGEIPAISFLLAGYLYMLAGWTQRPWLVAPSVLFWSLGLSAKPQTLPFFAVSLATPLVMVAARREWRLAGLLAGALIGSLLGFVVWEQLPGILFPQVVLPQTRVGLLIAGLLGQRADTMLDVVVVSDLAPKLSEVTGASFIVLPALGGIFYAFVLAARQWRSPALWQSDAQVVQLAILSLTTSWWIWWMFLSIGWLRYLFPALFLSSIFLAALLHDLTAGFSVYSLAARLRALPSWLLRLAWGAALLAVAVAMILAIIATFRTVDDAFRSGSDNSLLEVIDYLNQETPGDAVIETFESELYFLLDRPYHYPPNEVQIQLNRRTFLGEDAAIDYDPLAADPHILVYGLMADMWQLYQAELKGNDFRFVRQIGAYSIYRRNSARPASPPNIAAGAPIDLQLGDLVRLRTVAVPAGPTPAGATVPVTLVWSSLAAIDRDLAISLRLRDQDRLVAQQDEPIQSSWFVPERVEPGHDYWSLHRLRIPEGLHPGRYDLRAVVYEPDGAELQPERGGMEIDLGTLEVAAQMTARPSLAPATTLAPCLALISATPDATTALIGSPWGISLLWETRCQPTDDVALRFFLDDGAGRREIALQPLDASYPPSQWQAGQRVLTRSQLRLPADLEAGDALLSVEAIDPRSGQPFSRRWGPLPLAGLAEIATLSLEARPYDTTAPLLANTADASFGGQVRLLGYEVATSGEALAAGHPVTVTLAWQAEQAMEASYSVFLHLLDAGGQIVAQHDAAPRNGELPTSIWLPGEVVVDRLVLQPPTSLLAGEYTLITGLYDPQNWQRLDVAASSGQSSRDHVILGKITVAAEQAAAPDARPARKQRS